MNVSVARWHGETTSSLDAMLHPAEQAAARPARGDRCQVMGVLNVTPDSFSDGGAYLALENSLAHGLRLAADGADVIDVGGESTRPDTNRASEADELSRVLPVVRELAARGLTVSIDTMRASIAVAAVEAGAAIVNDVSGGLADPAMAHSVAELGVPYVAMHWRGHSKTMQSRATYRDVVATVKNELGHRMEALVGAGVDPSLIILDPGLGFAKTAEHNWELLSRLNELAVLGAPLLIGASRKRFLKDLFPETAGAMTDRDHATTAVSALAASRGASCVRVHEVRPTVAAVRVAKAAAQLRGFPLQSRVRTARNREQLLGDRP